MDFYVAETAGGETNGLGNLLGDADIGGAQVDVVSDQEFARAHHDGAGGRVANRVAHVRVALGHRPHLFEQRLELAAAYVFEVHTLGPPGRRFVKVDGNLQLVPDLAAHALGELDAILQRHALDGDKRHHVRRPYARVHALVPGQVDERRRFFNRAEGGIGHRRGRPDEGQHRAVMIGVRSAIQQDHFRNRNDGLDDRIHLGGIAPFGKIGNTLNQLSHHSVCSIGRLSLYKTAP